MLMMMMMMIMSNYDQLGIYYALETVARAHWVSLLPVCSAGQGGGRRVVVHFAWSCGPQEIANKARKL